MEEKSFLYKSANHTANLNNMRLNNKWCDVTVKVNGREIHAHKVILAANLKYFNAMLSNDSFKESKLAIIPMEGVDGKNLEAFVSYAYTGEILLTDVNALSLLELANYLGEDGIKDACIAFLIRNLKVEQALQAYYIGCLFDSLLLKSAAKQIILSNFEICSQTIDFLDFHYEPLVDIFSNAKAQTVESQKSYFEGIMSWIKYDIQNRRIRINDLLSSINIAKFTPDYLLGYLYKNVVDCNDVFRSIRDEVMHYYQMNKNQQMQRQVLIIMGMDNNDDAFKFQSYDLLEKKWSFPKDIVFSHVVVHSNSVVLNDELYYTTINRQGTHLNKFNSIANQNLIVHSSTDILRFSALCTCTKFLYLCGGIGNNGFISNRLLQYDPSANSFKTLAAMKNARFNAAAIFCQGCLLVVGGVYLAVGLKSVEKYDPRTDEWTVLSSMLVPRYSHAVAVLDGKLYACGGRQTNVYHSSAEVYDPSTNSWRLVANMNNPRFGFLVVAYEGKLFAIGGDYERTVEVYDPLKDEWQMDEELSSALGRYYRVIGGLIPLSCIPDPD